MGFFSNGIYAAADLVHQSKTIKNTKKAIFSVRNELRNTPVSVSQNKNATASNMTNAN